MILLDSHVLLDITTAHAEAIRRFPELARHDPLDRILLAEAVEQRLTLLTADRVLLAMHHSRVADATA